LNFGQHRFLYPPDEIDKKPFKAVLQALLNTDRKKESGMGGKDKDNAGMTNKDVSKKIPSPARPSTLDEEISRVIEEQKSSQEHQRPALSVNLLRAPVGNNNVDSNVHSAISSPVLPVLAPSEASNLESSVGLTSDASASETQAQGNNNSEGSVLLQLDRGGYDEDEMSNSDANYEEEERDEEEDNEDGEHHYLLVSSILFYVFWITYGFKLLFLHMV
jgi:hypothetical protein